MRPLSSPDTLLMVPPDQRFVSFAESRPPEEFLDLAKSGELPPDKHKACVLVQVTIYHRLQIGLDGNLEQSEAYDIS